METTYQQESYIVAKIKIALFGGGFNPIALHHEQIAQLIWNRTGMRTWFMPCYQHKFGKDSELIGSGHRWNMVQEVTNQYSDQMLAFDWEIARHFDGSMWMAMDELERVNGDKYDFHIVIGMDNANIIKTEWQQGDFLIERFPFIVIERAGVERTANWFDEKHHTIIPFSERISSSEIRECVAAGKHNFAKRYLNPRVWDYIVAGQLYGYQRG